MTLVTVLPLEGAPSIGDLPRRWRLVGSFHDLN